jgi:hypothetical protein
MAKIKIEPPTKKSPAHNSMRIRNMVKHVLMLGDSRRIVRIGRVYGFEIRRSSSEAQKKQAGVGLNEFAW